MITQFNHFLYEVKRSSGMRRIDYISPQFMEDLEIKQVWLDPQTDLQDLKQQHRLSVKTKLLFPNEYEMYKAMQKEANKFKRYGKHIKFICYNNGYYFVERPNGELYPLKPKL
jgi:hypothetical protein